MKFKIDENLPAGLVDALRGERHNVATASDESLGGAKDPTLLAAAVAERRVLMTFDLDFADARAYPPGSHHGIVVFRLPNQRWRTLEPELRRMSPPCRPSASPPA